MRAAPCPRRAEGRWGRTSGRRGPERLARASSLGHYRGRSDNDRRPRRGFERRRIVAEQRLVARELRLDLRVVLDRGVEWAAEVELAEARQHSSGYAGVAHHL